VIKEAIEFVLGVGRDGEKPTLTQLPGNKVMVTRGGTEMILDENRRSRADKVADVESLLEWLKLESLAESTVEIQVNAREIVICAGYEEPSRSICTMPLEKSPAMKLLESWLQTAFVQRQIVRALRGPLWGLCNPGYLAIFKSIDFARAKSNKANLTHASESLGRSVENAAQSSAGAIPEELVFDMTAYLISVPVDPTTVRFALDVEHDVEKFNLSPIGIAWDEMAASERRQIADWFKGQVPAATVTVGV
jgi:hypothetical protein